MSLQMPSVTNQFKCQWEVDIMNDVLGSALIPNESRLQIKQRK